MRPDRDLGAVPGLAGDRDDLHRAACDLGHLQGEQLLHQARVRARQGHRGPAVALAHVQHVAADPFAVDVTLAGHLLGGRQHRLELAQVDQDRPGVLALLDHPGHDVALAARVLAEGQLVFDVAEPLQDHLPGGGRGDPAEPGRGVVVLPHRGPVRAGLDGPHGDVPALPVHLDARRR